jgi:hypothetical protein
MQVSFCSVQLFGAGSHQIQRSSTGLLQSFSTACAIVLMGRPATDGRVPGTDAGCGLSIRGLLAGPAICNERQWV